MLNGVKQEIVGTKGWNQEKKKKHAYTFGNKNWDTETI